MKQQVIIIMLIILLTLRLLIFQSSQLNISSVFSPPVASNSHTYIITSHHTYIHAMLAKSHLFNPILLTMKDSQYTPSTNRDEWLDVDPILSTEYDYEGLTTGRHQYAWLSNPGIGRTVYFQIINFQPWTASSYTIIVSESSTWLVSCLPYPTYKLTNYCFSCPATFEGVFCTIPSHPLKADSTTSISLPISSYSYFSIPAENSISLKINVRNGGVMVYFQHAKYDHELAGIVNYLSSNNGEGKIIFSQSREQIFNNISYKQYSISIGVINTNGGSPVNIQMTYSINSSVNTLIVVIGIVGGFLLLSIIILVVILIKRYRNQQQIAAAPSLVRPGSQQLNQEQINLYFPPVVKRMVFFNEASSFTKIVDKQQQEKYDHECAICLSSIIESEIIRVCYCKHIFHSNCLEQWFKKQQNCPYCRQNYSRKATIELYSKLTKQIGCHLSGAQLAKEIFKQKKMNVTLQDLNFDNNEL